MTAAADSPELHADLSDVLRMVASLDVMTRLGQEWRRRALALSDAAPDVERMDGLVIEGEVYALDRVRQEWAPCGCKDGQHEFSTDAPWFKRGYWTEKAAAMKTAETLRGHVVTHLVATTPMEITT